MAFSYSLFVVLLLIFPGLCFWAGWRYGERTDFLTPSPDVPNSTLTLFIVALGTLIGHSLGTILYVMQEFWCKYTGIYFITSFDPNIYRTIIKGATAAGDAPDIAYALWFLSMLSIGGATGALANYMSRWRWITDRLDRVAFGWLTPMVQAVKKGDVFIIAEVITKTSNDGALVAYEGTVQQLALDGDQSVKLIVLKDVDGFLIKITGKGLLRLKSKPIPNALLQITASEIANVTLEAIEVSEAHPV